MIRTNGYLGLQPLCGGVAPDLAWRSLRLIEPEVLPRTSEPSWTRGEPTPMHPGGCGGRGDRRRGRCDARLATRPWSTASFRTNRRLTLLLRAVSAAGSAIELMQGGRHHLAWDPPSGPPPRTSGRTPRPRVAVVVDRPVRPRGPQPVTAARQKRVMASTSAFVGGVSPRRCSLSLPSTAWAASEASRSGFGLPSAEGLGQQGRQPGGVAAGGAPVDRGPAVPEHGEGRGRDSSSAAWAARPRPSAGPGPPASRSLAIWWAR